MEACATDLAVHAADHLSCVDPVADRRGGEAGAEGARRVVAGAELRDRRQHVVGHHELRGVDVPTSTPVFNALLPQCPAEL